MNPCTDMDNFYARDIPVAPLPNPGEGGPAFPGGGNIPVAPLPNPGEGGPIFPGGGNTPVFPLPNPGQGGPAFPGGSNNPVVPLPGPGQGGPVFPGGGSNIPVIPLPNPGQNVPAAPGIPGQIIIPVFPQPNLPCFFCSSGRYGEVRFLNAANGYLPFRIFINNRFIVNGLGFASLTPYGQVSSGFQTITVAGMNGYVYLQKSLPFRPDDIMTVAIINTASGIDLLEISDAPCVEPSNLSCLRVSNLADNSGPLDVILYDGRVVYSDVRFKETTAFKRIRPGQYEFYLAETNLRPMPRMEDIETLRADFIPFEMPEALVSFFVDVRANAMYTVYILSRDRSPDVLQTLVVEDRK